MVTGVAWVAVDQRAVGEILPASDSRPCKEALSVVRREVLDGIGDVERDLCVPDSQAVRDGVLLPNPLVKNGS